MGPPTPAIPATPGPGPAEPTRGPSDWRTWLEDCFALDARSLAVFRIALAVVVLGDLAIRATDLAAFYTDAGLVPRTRLGHDGFISVHALGGSAAFVAGVFLLHAAFAVALLVGYRTRLATFATCFLLVSLHNRNPHVLQGGDAFLRVLLFWGIFLPLGARWSLDARGAPPGEPRRVLSAASAALVLQVCFLYWFSVALKSDPAWRGDGTAVYYALSIDQLAKPAGQWLLGYPGLMAALTHASFALEAVGPLLLFVPVFRWQVRVGVVAAFLVFHLVGLNLCLELGPFPYVCAAAWLALLPTPFWDRVVDRAADPPPAGFLAEPPALNVLAGLFLAYVFLWNLRTLDFERFQVALPRALNPVGTAFGIDQYWAMFSPGPPRDDGWFVCVATLANGQEVDLLRDGVAVRWDKPALVSALYPNERWRKFLMNLPRAGQEENRAALLTYLAGRWDRANPPERQVRRVELHFVLEETPPPGEPTETRPLLLGYFGEAPP